MLSIPSCIFGHSDSTVVKGQCLVSSVCWQGEQERVLSAVMTGFADTRLPGFLLRNLACKAATHFYDVCYLRIGLLMMPYE